MTSPYLAAAAGTLPKDGDRQVSGITLPPGLPVVPDPSFSDRRSAATPQTLWVTKEEVPDVGDLCLEFAAEFPTHGLWPLILESLHGSDDRPWLAGEISPGDSSGPWSHDAKSVLESQWADAIPVEEEAEEAMSAVAPFSRTFPGLAPAPAGPGDPAVLEVVVGTMSGRLGLVSVQRPADALAAIGWLGPVNVHADMGPLSAVLRSWEDRFGAILVGMGFDTLTLAVQRPPDTLELATQVAAEHFAFCPDNIYQGAGSIEEYAAGLVGQSVWAFWWD